MVQLFQHPVLEKNRNSDKIRMAFEQLWNHTDLRVSTDRVGFNPPETADWKFPGPRLPLGYRPGFCLSRLGCKVLLYLADTEEKPGCV